MSGPRQLWQATTHGWDFDFDEDHIVHIQTNPAEFAAGGVLHLVLEVVAYVAEEAQATGKRGLCRIDLHSDGSVAIMDDGRGTDTRLDDQGRAVRKPIMATKDLRFFDDPRSPLLPDGHRRRGMSVVAALSEWLVHLNRRREGAWAQRYRNGRPEMDLVEVPVDGTTGTTVTFRPDVTMGAVAALSVRRVAELTAAWPELDVAVRDLRTQ